jgi:hypothetical protein
MVARAARRAGPPAPAPRSLTLARRPAEVPLRQPPDDALGGLLARAVAERAEIDVATGAAAAGTLQRVAVRAGVLEQRSVAENRGLVAAGENEFKVPSGPLTGYTVQFHANDYAGGNLTSFTGRFTPAGATKVGLTVTFEEEMDVEYVQATRTYYQGWGSGLTTVANPHGPQTEIRTGTGEWREVRVARGPWEIAANEITRSVLEDVLADEAQLQGDEAAGQGAAAPAGDDGASLVAADAI